MIDDAWAALHILLFLVLPETPEELDEACPPRPKGDITAWFPFWGALAGVFCYGLFILMMRLLSLTEVDNLERLAFALIPLIGMSFFSPMFAAWFGTPRKTDGLAAVCSGRPGRRGIITALVFAVLFLLLETVLMPFLTAVFFYLGTVVIALVVPHVLARFCGGTTGGILAVSSIVLGMAQLVFFVIVGV